ncbi:MAG TPA: alkaline phosphatase family protein [Gaiellaceae bacterium]|nr:alkaline phosphatase family protein [Gaiellaceae bacterium]
MKKRYGVLAVIAAAAALAATTAFNATAASPSVHSGLDHFFVIMLENHSEHSVIDQRDAAGNLVAPYITQLAHTYSRATHYYGVTHPSEPNYIASITGSNWGLNDDNLHVLDVPNIVDQLESHGLTWNAYMEALDTSNKLAPTAPGSTALYAIKHDPFALMQDIRDNPARMAHIKPYDDLAADLASGNVGNYVWITPDQCNDMHGGVYAPIPGRPETPCPYGDAVNIDAADVALQHNADAFVKRTVQAIMSSPAWTQNSAIFVTADENDFDGANPSVGSWEDASGCCDSPVLPAGDPFVSPDWPGGVYGGGLVPAILITTHSNHAFVDDTSYNHYSLLATLEKMWKLGYLQNAGDRANVPTMDALFAH